MGLLLIPRTEPSPTSSASGDIAAEVSQGDMLERSTLFRDGIFTDVEETNGFIKVSKESSMKCFTTP